MHADLERLLQTMLPVAKRLHAEGQLAPHAASLGASHEIRAAGIGGVDAGLSVEEALRHFEARYRDAAVRGEIIASALFFHGAQGSRPRAATNTAEAASLVALLEHETGESWTAVMPYRRAGDTFVYDEMRLAAKRPAVFAPQKRAWWRLW